MQNLIDGHSPQTYLYGFFRVSLMDDDAAEHSSVTNHQGSRPTLPLAVHFTHTYPPPQPAAANYVWIQWT